MGQGVQGFTLNKEGGDFILTHPDMRIPERGALYAMNEGTSLEWDPRVVEWLRRMKLGEGEGNMPHRCVGWALLSTDPTLCRSAWRHTRVYTHTHTH